MDRDEYTQFLEDYDRTSSPLHETRDTEVFSSPTKLPDLNVHWIRISTCQGHCHHTTLGKWMVFKHFDEIDRYWEKIRTAIFNYDMKGCISAKCSTMIYHPTKHGPGPNTVGVICVYTSKYDIDAIGFRLIEIAQQDIKYSLDDDSRDYSYVHAGSGQVSTKTIYWNNGKPSFDCVDQKPCCGTSYDKQDQWHLNVVDVPFATQSIYGRWILPLEYEEMTGLWHYLKKLIELEEDMHGVIKIECPPKRNRDSATEVPVFHVYTSDADREMVGSKFMNLIKRDIRYEAIHVPGDRIESPSYTLLWNYDEEGIIINKPSQIYEEPWVCMPSESDVILAVEESSLIGHWMVFKHFDEVDLTWEQICRAMARGTLQCCPKAKCSTVRYCPGTTGPGPVTKAVIFVYASEEQDIDIIGFQLIEIAKQDVKYKSFDSSEFTIFWNNGKPSFDCEDMPCRGTSDDKEDIWKLNVVTAPEPLGSLYDHGRWVLPSDWTKSTPTGLWHKMRKKITSAKPTEIYGVIKMVCPKGRRSDTPVFHFYTNNQHWKSVGTQLINLAKRDICYEHRPYNGTGHMETLFWNDGEPVYERITRKGITKNWRTGEDL